VRIQVASAPGEVTLTVSDTGIGIKPENIAGLFQAFRQVDGSARRVYEGTGLGLYLCKKLSTMLGGRIHAESEFGLGSRFTVTLPNEPPASVPPP
jgi:signal transduction histidine kinase